MRPKKLHSPVTLFAAIEESQYELLRSMAFKERQSIADLVRAALADYLGKADASGPATHRVRAGNKSSRRKAVASHA